MKSLIFVKTQEGTQITKNMWLGLNEITT